MERTLQEAGLTLTEAKVYRMLVRLKKATIGDLAERTAFHRRTLYDCLDRLQDKGLASVMVEGKTSYFLAAEPHQLIRILKEQQQEMGEHIKNIETILPQLIAELGTASTGVEAVVYKGTEGFKSVFEEMLHAKAKEILCFSSSGHGPDKLPFYVPQFHQQRMDAKRLLRIMFPHDALGEKRAAEMKNMNSTHIRFNKSRAHMPISIWVWGNRAALMLWDADIVVRIKDAATAEGFAKYFEILWEQASHYK